LPKKNKTGKNLPSSQAVLPLLLSLPSSRMMVMYQEPVPWMSQKQRLWDQLLGESFDAHLNTHMTLIYCTHNPNMMKLTRKRCQIEQTQSTTNFFMKWTKQGAQSKQHGWSKRRREAPCFDQTSYIMLKTNILYDSLSAMNVVYHSSCTFRSSEFICSSSGGAQEKGETGWN
jgi:hypothetical protein